MIFLLSIKKPQIHRLTYEIIRTKFVLISEICVRMNPPADLSYKKNNFKIITFPKFSGSYYFSIQ